MDLGSQKNDTWLVTYTSVAQIFYSYFEGHLLYLLCLA
jgi:hypothetical protein